jgi:hypothetical protein
VTDEDLPNQSIHTCQLHLPELGRSLNVDVEVLYRASGSGESSRGFGVRFQRFHDGAEPVLIRYLSTLDQTTAA